MNNIVIFGGTSAIAKGTVLHLVKKYPRANFILVGRNSEKTKLEANDLSIRHNVSSTSLSVSFTDFNAHKDFFEKLKGEVQGDIDLFILAQGSLTNQEKSHKDFSYFKDEFDLNFMSYVSFGHHIATYLENKRKGAIVFISSVAGDRGRQSNYSYGSSKSALTTFTSGLRNRLTPFNVQVLTVLPGFVDTPMTKDFKKGPIWATPSQVGQDIVRALDKKRDKIYTPFFWRYIMMIIIHIPEFIFKKLKL